jgi:hypothetical protein
MGGSKVTRTFLAMLGPVFLITSDRLPLVYGTSRNSTAIFGRAFALLSRLV